MAERDPATATIERQNESLPTLFARLTDELMQLVDAKLELLRTELRQEVGVYALGAVLILAGVVIAIVGFALLNVAIAFLISTLFDAAQWSPAARYALGYTVGYSHKVAKTSKDSQFAKFTDNVVEELSHVGQRLVLPELNAKIRQLFGYDFTGLLDQVRGKEKTTGRKRLTTRTRRPKSRRSTKAPRKRR